MKISVFIIAYNEQDYIYDCLDALMHQSEKPDEIIVVDNNSTDQTVNIARQFPGVKIVSEKKQGMTYARNRGFNVAKYPLIARLDADTRVPKNWIKRIKGQFKNNSIDALSGPILFYDLTNPLVSNFFSTLCNNGAGILFRLKILSGPQMVLKRKIWQMVRGTVCLDDSKVHEDVDLTVHVLEAGGVIKYDKKLVAHVSGRRIKKKPVSYFIEYPLRGVKMWYDHHSN